MKKQLLLCSALGLLAIPPVVVSHEVSSEPAPSPPPMEETSCPLAWYEHLKGEKEKDLPRLMEQIPEDERAKTIRIVCHNCAVTMDYSPTRLNIMLDEKARVSRLSCG